MSNRSRTHKRAVSKKRINKSSPVTQRIESQSDTVATKTDRMTTTNTVKSRYSTATVHSTVMDTTVSQELKKIGVLAVLMVAVLTVLSFFF